MTFQQFMAIFKARLGMAVGVMLGVIALGVLISVLLPKRYTSMTQVLVDVRAPDPTTGQSLNPGFVQGYMATQVDMVNSQRVALRVVDMLKLDEESVGGIDLTEVTSSAKESAEELRRRAIAQKLSKKLEVRPSRESSILEIGYTDSNSERAAAISNAFAKAYMESSVQVRVEPALQTKSFFDEQAVALRKTLDEAQARLTAYQRANGITSNDERLDVEISRLQELSTQLTTLQSQTVDSDKRQQSARGAGGAGVSDSPEVLANPLVQSLKAEQGRLQGKLREQSATLGLNHPEIVRLQRELESVTSRLAAEVQTISGSLSRSYQVNRGRLQELEGSLAAQRGKVLQMRTIRSEISNLQRDVDSAQKAYDAVAARLNQTALESKATQANIVVVNAATAAIAPSSPKMLLNLGLSIALGLVLAAVSVLLTESRNRRVRTSDDLLLMLDAPVLGEVRNVPKRGMGGARRRGKRPAPRAARKNATDVPFEPTMESK